MQTRLLQALAGTNKGRPPVWFMRQSGRYLPEYRSLRANRSFMELVKNPALVAEATLLPLRRFDLDAAIIFSDILVVLDALQRGLHFDEGQGPIIDRPVRNGDEVRALPEIEVEEELSYVAQGIKNVLPHLNVPLIGFCGAPFTVASYLIEGKSSKDFATTKKWLRKDPTSFHELLGKLTRLTISYLRMQVAAGVKVLQIFDTWANALSYAHFREFSLAYMEQIVRGVADLEVPVILFCKGSSLYVRELAEVSSAGISLDWNGSLPLARKEIGPSICLQGNLDPYALYGSKDSIRKEVSAMLSSMQGDPAYIFNLGHGVLPDIPVDGVKAMVDCVVESRAAHAARG